MPSCCCRSFTVPFNVAPAVVTAVAAPVTIGGSGHAAVVNRVRPVGRGGVGPHHPEVGGVLRSSPQSRTPATGVVLSLARARRPPGSRSWSSTRSRPRGRAAAVGIHGPVGITRSSSAVAPHDTVGGGRRRGEGPVAPFVARVRPDDAEVHSVLQVKPVIAALTATGACPIRASARHRLAPVAGVGP